MRKIFLFTDLFNEVFDNLNKSESFPKENDKDFNKTVEESETETHVTKTETWKSLDGKRFFKRTVIESKSSPIETSIEQLKEKMQIAVKNEDFETAAKIRDEIKKIKQ